MEGLLLSLLCKVDNRIDSCHRCTQSHHSLIHFPLYNCTVRVRFV